MVAAIYLYIGFICITFALWFYYVMVMGMKAARNAGRIPLQMKRLCGVVALVGLIFDVAYNISIATVLFVDFPREATLTGRLIRYKKSGGWRGRIADYICSQLLDPFAPNGCHCKIN